MAASGGVMSAPRHGSLLRLPGQGSKSKESDSVRKQTRLLSVTKRRTRKIEQLSPTPRIVKTKQQLLQKYLTTAVCVAAPFAVQDIAVEQKSYAGCWLLYIFC